MVWASIGMSEQDRELRGWDEICAHLGLSRRTAQNYERTRHLPVRRLDGPRGRVLAYASELDAWKVKYYSLSEISDTAEVGEERREELPREADEETQDTGYSLPKPAGSNRRKYLWMVAGLTIISALLLVLFLQSSSSPPHSFRTDTQSLIALDERQRVLWQFKFSAPLSEYYGSTPNGELLWSGNLDEDSETETLFRYNPITWNTDGGQLYCFSQQGKVKWRFTPGRKVSDLTGSAYETYGSGPFRILKRSASHSARVVMTSAHVNSFPNQIAVLDGHGRLVGEYWHSGQVLMIGLADLDGDGVEDIFAGGVNNGFGQATVVVLDPRRVRGASVQKAGDSSQLTGLGPGSEKAVIRFPRSCIVDLLEPFNRVSILFVRDSGLEVHVAESHKREGPYLIYDFDRHLKLTKVTVSDIFLNRHRELESTGQLKHSFTDKEKKAFEQGVEVLWGQGTKVSPPAR